MIKIREVLISKETYHTTKKGNKVYIRNGKIIVPTSLTIHSTGNLKSTAVNERNWLTNSTNSSGASWNICVDEKEAVIAIPLNEKSNHSGNGTGNNTSIGLEICESGDREKTLRNAIQVSAYILKKFNLTHENLKQHYDWNKKNCPRILRDTGRWEWFINEVKKEMEVPNMPKYNTLEEIPEWGKQTAEKLINKGALKGDENEDLNITEEMLRTFVIHDRLGIYDLKWEVNMHKNTVTQEEIDKIIAESEIEVKTIFEKCTTVTVKLKNGFVLTESSACVDKQNYDMETGKKICMERIKNKLWELEGYKLQCELAISNN